MALSPEIRVQESENHGFSPQVNERAVQLDGLRAIAMVAICWDHWCPQDWPRLFPFEICLFFFLVLTGYLITASLLRERKRHENLGGNWRFNGWKTFQIRRGLRILAPYFAALAVAWLVRAPDVIGPAVAWYLLHFSNIHMAFLGYWPAGTSHFWSLSMQQQFYLGWPLLIWWLPKRHLVAGLIAFSALGPISRLFHDTLQPHIAWPALMTWCSFDYFGIGSLLALAVQRGMPLRSQSLRWISGIALLGYLLFFIGHPLHWPTFGLRAFQQTFLAIALCGVIAAGAAGFSGRLKSFLEHPWVQRVGQVSYGIYLFHNLAPLVSGKLFWFLWDPCLQTPLGAILRFISYAAITWGLALASWRWIEKPLQSLRSSRSKPSPDFSGKS